MNKQDRHSDLIDKPSSQEIFKPIEIMGRGYLIGSNGTIIRKRFIAHNGRSFRAKIISTIDNGNGYKYFHICVDGRKSNEYVHRAVAMAHIDVYSKELECDHISGDKSDNRVCNLRMVTTKQNRRGYMSKQKRTISKHRGVRPSLNKWSSRITFNGVETYLGVYESETEAALAYNAKAVELGFANEALNVIQEAE